MDKEILEIPMLDTIHDLPKQVENWMGMPIADLRRAVGSTEADVRSMTKAQLVAVLVKNFIEDRVIDSINRSFHASKWTLYETGL